MVNRVVMACLVLHNLLRIRYCTAQQEDFGWEGQPPIVLEGNDIPYEGCNAIGPAKIFSGTTSLMRGSSPSQWTAVKTVL